MLHFFGPLYDKTTGFLNERQSRTVIQARYAMFTWKCSDHVESEYLKKSIIAKIISCYFWPFFEINYPNPNFS